jgi:hypothetical protein
MGIALYSLAVTLTVAALSLVATIPGVLFVAFVVALLVPACWHRWRSSNSSPFRRA